MMSSGSSNAVHTRSSSSEQVSSSMRRRRSNLSCPFVPTVTSAGVPFSWEDHPGIPKPAQTTTRTPTPNSSSNSITTCHHRLPLPPAAGRRLYHQGRLRDPFLTALLECSKNVDLDDRPRKQVLPRRSWSSVFSEKNRVGRMLMNLIHAHLSVSCRRSCPVSDSAIVFDPAFTSLA